MLEGTPQGQPHRDPSPKGFIEVARVDQDVRVDERSR
jgi:hypothetical protein